MTATFSYPEPAQSSPYLTSHFLKIHLNIILSSTPGSPQWSLSLRFPHQNSVHASPLPHTRYMPCPSHYTRFHSYINKTKSYLIYAILKRYTKLLFVTRAYVSLFQPFFHGGAPTYENVYRPENKEAVGSAAEVTSVLPIAGQKFPLHFEGYLGIFAVANLLCSYGMTSRGYPNNVPRSPGWEIPV